MSCTYFIWAEGTKLVKIGSTAGDPEDRRKQLQTGSPQKLILLGSVPGVEAEKRFHRDLAHLRSHGEWYEAYDVLRITLVPMTACFLLREPYVPALRLVR